MAILKNRATQRKIHLRTLHVFGRGRSSDTLLENPDASQLHASIRWTGSTWELHDHSRNGTLLDGELVGRQRVFRALAAGTAVTDHQRGFARQGLEGGFAIAAGLQQGQLQRHLLLWVRHACPVQQAVGVEGVVDAAAAFAPELEADLGPATTLAAGASHQDNTPTGNLWGALPLFFTDGTPTNYDVSTSTSADWSYWNSSDTRAFVELAHALDNGWTIKAAVNHEEMEEQSELFYVYGTPDPVTGLGLFAYPSAYGGRFKALSADVFATGPMRLGGRDHDVVVGASWADGNNRELSWYGNDVGTPLAPGQAFDGSYPKPSFDSYSDGSDFDYGRESVYATVRWNLADSFKLITGINRTRVDTEGFSYGESNTVDESRTTPFAGAVLDLGPVWSVYASYGEIFSQQSEVDANNRLVGPIEGSNAEIGLKGEWFDGGLNASLAVFRADQDNLAEYAGFDTGTGRSYYAGVDARSQGVELDFAGRLGEHWHVAGGYTVLELEGTDGSDARTYVPRQLLRLSSVVDLAAVPGLSLGANLRWQSAIDREAVAYDALGTATPLRIEQPSYALLGLMANYAINERWSATLNLDNVTDEKYLTSLYWEQGYYGAPRGVTLSVGYRF